MSALKCKVGYLSLLYTYTTLYAVDQNDFVHTEICPNPQSLEPTKPEDLIVLILRRIDYTASFLHVVDICLGGAVRIQSSRPARCHGGNFGLFWSFGPSGLLSSLN